mmetsp:Transcript_32052/g.55281  ORF Transcript_32052/g.55281 Transcript_32052/m.55281 type:complete len:147 (-) Transcript_32052:558-998(-)|eukprot:CAMPEP_0204901078 /NCGR_PEP_ID=MMETSP1397-20131031/2861_1 /ASSEMBLY_ACC=CAM_ASM_000891 /TAXON_ID=49980 /ORGANISM="Climacostomum Climacostomum virens, Strain Stock W-24" /LENGTH=146 /DNA_ID=CAMNT_0052069363 /DNA_START=1393 /DNA_END=1836 /DNA_ORIENTATION=-
MGDSISRALKYPFTESLDEEADQLSSFQGILHLEACNKQVPCVESELEQAGILVEEGVSGEKLADIVFKEISALRDQAAALQSQAEGLKSDCEALKKQKLELERKRRTLKNNLKTEFEPQLESQRQLLEQLVAIKKSKEAGSKRSL